MSQPVWAQAFPGGVADAELQHALWRDGSGHLVALRLADGQLLWRSAQPLVPLLLGHGLALGLALAPARVVALALAGNAAGDKRWCSDTLPWPDWALRLDALPAATDLQAAWLDEDIALHWHLRPAYAGGAVPGPLRAKAVAAMAAVGSCLLDAAAGTLRAAPAGLDNGGPGPVAQEPCSDPGVIAQSVLGGVRYRLQQQPSRQAPPRQPSKAAGDTLHTALVAHDLARGQDLWQRALDAAPAKAPRALRP